MPKCSVCGGEFRGHQCPGCGAKPKPSTREINKALANSPLPSLAGLFGILAANYCYPLLDSNTFLWIGLLLFFFPIIFHIVSAVRKQLARDVNRLKTIYFYSGAAMLLFALVLAANGFLDPSSVLPVQSSIVRKNVTSGRHSSTNHLHVTSWRPGRTIEDLHVGDSLYSRAFVGEPVTVETHQGLFRFPWYGKITLD